MITYYRAHIFATFVAIAVGVLCPLAAAQTESRALAQGDACSAWEWTDPFYDSRYLYFGCDASDDQGRERWIETHCPSHGDATTWIGINQSEFDKLDEQFRTAVAGTILSEMMLMMLDDWTESQVTDELLDAMEHVLGIRWRGHPDLGQTATMDLGTEENQHGIWLGSTNAELNHALSRAIADEQLFLWQLNDQHDIYTIHPTKKDHYAALVYREQCPDAVRPTGSR